MGRLRKGSATATQARHRRTVAFVLAFAMAAELVPAQGIRGVLRLRGVAEAATGAEASQQLATADGAENEGGGLR